MSVLPSTRDVQSFDLIQKLLVVPSDLGLDTQNKY